LNSNYARDLKNFADKLASDDCLSESEIKTTMAKLDLIYTEDEIERLNRVLLALHPISKRITEDHSLNNNLKKEINH